MLWCNLLTNKKEIDICEKFPKLKESTFQYERSIVKASDLELKELLHIERGALALQGRRLVLHSINAFGQFRKDLLDTFGPDHTRRLFTRFGFFWGQADAATLERAFRWDSQVEMLRAGARLQTLEGTASVDIVKLEWDEQTGRLHLECIWKNSAEAEEHLNEVGTTDTSVCWKLVGYASGFATRCLGRPVYFVEHTCTARGEALCSGIGKDLESWGSEIEPHLRYFEADDIMGRVEHLNRELRKKTRLLSEQRKRLSDLTHQSAPFLVEGRSKALHQVLDLAERVARFDSSVLITGETGVGKEVLARYIHSISTRGRGQFVAINCSAIPESLLESELFGHKAGSFTGAIRDRVGLLEEAAGGTVFLDEAGDVGPAMQVKLLRVLQDKVVTRVGENQPRPIDVRIIAATNRDLEKMVGDGSFREDLLYRLRVIEIRIPPLRERREDILPLSRFLVERLAKRLKIPHLRLDATCVDYLQAYSWPGNVRELENAIERAAVLSPEGVILPDYLPPHLVGEAIDRAGHHDQLSKTLARVEMEHILAVLRSTGDNRTRTAEVLGVSPATLWRRLKQEK